MSENKKNSVNTLIDKIEERVRRVVRQEINMALEEFQGNISKPHVIEKNDGLNEGSKSNSTNWKEKYGHLYNDMKNEFNQNESYTEPNNEPQNLGDMTVTGDDGKTQVRINEQDYNKVLSKITKDYSNFL